jgi:superoxide dismutase
MSPPKALSRREVLQTASLLGISAAAGAALAADSPSAVLAMFKESGLVTGKMKPLKYEAIPGLLTKEQVTPHYQAHYGGALKRFTALEQQLDTLYQGKGPLAGDALTFMHKDKINRMNSVLLHELYFDGLAPKPGDPAEDIRFALAKRFGSLDRWIEDFKVCCMAANGWGMLVRDLVNGRLYNVSSGRSLARPAARGVRRLRTRVLHRLHEPQAGVRRQVRAIPGLERDQSADTNFEPLTQLFVLSRNMGAAPGIPGAVC